MIREIRRVGQHAYFYALSRSEQIIEWLNDELGDYTVEAQDEGRHITLAGKDKTITITGHLIASVAVNPQTLLWRWADDDTTSVAALIRDWGRDNGLRTLTTQEVPYEPLDAPAANPAHIAEDLGCLGFEVFGQDAMYLFFPFNKAGSQLVLLVENFSETPPAFDFAAFMTKLPRLITFADDVAWSMDGLTRIRPDWQVQHTPIADNEHNADNAANADNIDGADNYTDRWSITNEPGLTATYDLAYDSHRRVTAVRANLPAVGGN